MGPARLVVCMLCMHIIASNHDHLGPLSRAVVALSVLSLVAPKSGHSGPIGPTEKREVNPACMSLKRSSF